MWLVIIAVTIITFVFWGSRTSDSSSRGPENFGSVGGERVTRDSYINALHEVYLRYFLNFGQFPDKDAKRMGFDEEREAYFRLLLIQKQKELGVHVSSEAVAQTESQILRSFGRGNPIPPDVFVEQVLRREGLNKEDFVRFIEHDLGIQQLITTAGLGGKLVTPQEVRALYAREHEELSAEAVFFSASNYLAGVSAAPDAVAQYYTNQMAIYRVPVRLQVSYVKFEATNFLAEAVQEISKITNLTERIDAMYRERGTNYYREAKSPEEAKAKILEEEQKKLALSKARAKANESATALFALEPLRAENLERLAKTNGLNVGVSAPFDSKEGPKDLDAGPGFAKTAFALTADEPLAGPLVGIDAVYVIALNKRLESEVPSLESIRDRVTADYKFSQAVVQARRAGEEFLSALTNGLANGRKFADVCTETKARPVLLPPFSLSTRELPEAENHVNLTEFKQAAFSVAYGRPNRFVPTDEGGFVVFIQARLPLDEAKLQAELPAFINSVRQTRQNEAFNEWFRKQIERDPGLRSILEGMARRDRRA